MNLWKEVEREYKLMKKGVEELEKIGKYLNESEADVIGNSAINSTGQLCS